MKKCKYLVMFITLIFITAFFTGCSTKTTNVDVEFWLSADNGKTWTQDERVTYGGYETSVYIKLQVRVQTNSKTPTFPSVTLTLPDIDAIDAYIVGGPVVYPRKGVSNVSYDFMTRAIKDNQQFSELIIEFIPYCAVEFKVSVIFDDSIAPEYNTSLSINVL